MRKAGFGIPDTQDFVNFTILADARTGMYPDWDAPVVSVLDSILGSTDYEEQFTAFEPATLQLTIEFRDMASFRKFQTMLTRVRTLVLIADFTAHEGERVHWQGIDYEMFPDTTLVRIADRQLRVGEPPQCTVTFRRDARGMGVSLE